MKAVLISIRPQWCGKIVSGEKTIEVRKTRPKMETPFKCYIYCTKAEERLICILKDGDENYGEIYHGKPVFIKTDEGSVCDMWGKRQKVIGEFVCEEIVEIDGARRIQSDVARPTCLEPAELHKYLGVAVGYGWHISSLKIYDEPKELGEFTAACRYKNDDGTCPSRRIACSFQRYDYNPDGSINIAECGNTIRHPPQSWGYVEELRE
jgi:predicted transcriptional regulator